jgi:hypothetical protein
MKTKHFVVVGLCLATLTPLSAHSQFQMNKIFGGTKTNHGSVLPEWWNETDYNPPEIDGNVHIRVGSAGESGRYGQLGRANCDWVYLWAAKANTAMGAKEKEECALYEFYIKRGIDGDNRNVADGFVKREIIAEMITVVEARIARFRSAKTFYFRTTSLKVGAYDFNTRSAPVSINWHGYATDSARYVITGRGFEGETGTMKISLSASDEIARIVEAARYSTSNSYIHGARNIIYFEVVNAKQLSGGYTPTRAIEVRFREIAFWIVDAQNQTHRISIDNTQKL